MPKAETADPKTEDQTAQSAQPPAPPPDAWVALDGIIAAYQKATPENQAKVRDVLSAIYPAPVTDTEVRCTTYNAMSRTRCNALLADEATRPYQLYCRRCHLRTYSPEHPGMGMLKES